MFKRALVSTSDKSGLTDFLKPLVAAGCELVSTAGTSTFLKAQGFKVTEVSDVTGFPEVMDGRVRTLHPHIHMGLLARSFVKEDFEILKKHGVRPFDLVVVNLYPFEEAFQKGLKDRDLIEQIDIGGPSLLRAAAKSFERLTVICDPADYGTVLEQKEVNPEFRKYLASKVFQHCSYYDSIVAHALNDHPWTQSRYFPIGFKKKSELRYGENPHQNAVWYESGLKDSLSLNEAQIIQGKELSYNNILDLEAAVSVVSDFSTGACAIIKHNNPCGVACGRDTLEAYQRAFEGDSVSAFGGIVAFNSNVDEKTSQELAKLFLECVIAPDFEADALRVLAQKKNLRVLKLSGLAQSDTQKTRLEFKSLRGGALFQTSDHKLEWNSQWKQIGPQASEAIQKDMIFAQKVVRHVKSNAIVIAENQQTLGICGGQTNRVDSVKMALERVKGRGQNLVLASDAFFPFRDSIDLAARNKVRWVIQPGGSLRDSEVEAAALEHSIGMVITGVRQFKH